MEHVRCQDDGRIARHGCRGHDHGDRLACSTSRTSGSAARDRAYAIDIPHAALDHAGSTASHASSERGAGQRRIPPADSADVLVRTPEPGTAPALHGGASSLRREIDLLARIKSLVDTDPALAYRLARQGDRDFARGVLRQEREALAIVALANDDRRPEAARQLRAFVARYPHSPARERLEQILGAAGE